MIVTSITLLVVNFKSRDSFTNEVNAVHNYKVSRSYLSTSRLAFTMLYGFANIDNSEFDNLTINIHLNTTD